MVIDFAGEYKNGIDSNISPQTCFCYICPLDKNQYGQFKRQMPICMSGDWSVISITIADEQYTMTCSWTASQILRSLCHNVCVWVCGCV